MKKSFLWFFVVLACVLAKPSKPRFATLAKATSNSLSIVWVPPNSDFSCESDVYKVEYRKDEPGTKFQVLSVAGKEAIETSTAIIKGLDSKTKYVIKVTAFKAGTLSKADAGGFATLKATTK
mmetsp:Transcript_14005/g.19937  ORF Transcript_14005/g.19937 Transcript_14005/m.19937 type:complete len:122 (+) Transcript_14005:28-393(+)